VCVWIAFVRHVLSSYYDCDSTAILLRFDDHAVGWAYNDVIVYVTVIIRMAFK